MSDDQNLSESKGIETGSFRPSSSLLSFLDDQIKNTDDFYVNLKSEYASSVYEDFENRFINLRKKFKDKSQLLSDTDYLYLNRTEMRKGAVQQIIDSATAVAERFREAKANNRLDRPTTTDALENLINAIKNLKHLSESAR